MSWMNMLYKTYEANAALAGSSDEAVPLKLIAHIIQKAQLEVTVSSNGEFGGACEVPKDNAGTIIPVTEKSAGRSSGVAAHALNDTLAYIAGDFSLYLPEGKEKQNADKKYEAYITQLEKWAESEYSHPKAMAIYKYLSKCTLMTDLISAGVVTLDENNLLDGKKIGGMTYDKVLVRFVVYTDDISAEKNTWQDLSLMNSYIEYFTANMDGGKDICYISGKSETTTYLHPKGIVAANYGAKLLSSNDKTDFTFRGRFTSDEQAYAVSYEASQKAHAALAWLTARQGVVIGKKDKRTFVCWNPDGKPVVDIRDPFSFFEDKEPEKPMAYTEGEYRKRLYKAFLGYRGQLENSDNIVVIALDAATTGRLSVTYYNELTASDFYDRLEKWGRTCKWYFTRFTADKKAYTTVLTPNSKDIVNFAFGTETGNFVEAQDKVQKEQFQRILHCIIDNQPVPRDIIHALVSRASVRTAYSKWYNYENLLSVSCAFIAKEICKDDETKEEQLMALDTQNKDRSYLFGRLLAVLEKVEKSTYSSGEDRETNAVRLQTVYVKHPLHTWKTIENQLNPYFQRLNSGLRAYYKNIISEISEKLSEYDSDTLNRSLDDIYLIGYYLQRSALNQKKTTDNKEEIK